MLVRHSIQPIDFAFHKDILDYHFINSIFYNMPCKASKGTFKGVHVAIFLRAIKGQSMYRYDFIHLYVCTNNMLRFMIYVRIISWIVPVQFASSTAFQRCNLETLLLSLPRLSTAQFSSKSPAFFRFRRCCSGRSF